MRVKLSQTEKKKEISKLEIAWIVFLSIILYFILYAGVEATTLYREAYEIVVNKCVGDIDGLRLGNITKRITPYSEREREKAGRFITPEELENFSQNIKCEYRSNRTRD